MAKSDKSTYLVMLIVLIVVIYYHFNYKNHLHKYESFIEGYKNHTDKLNKNHIIGNVNTNDLVGNPILPKNDVKLYRIQGVFNNKKLTSKNQIHKLNVDELSDGVVLLPKGHVVIKYPENRNLNGFIIKGMKKCRVDINTNGSNNFKPLFTGEVRQNNVTNFNVFTKESINQNLGNNKDKQIKVKSVKITNIDNKNSNPIKLELVEQLNRQLDKNILSNKIENVKVVYPKNMTLNDPLLINKNNNKSIYLEIRLPKQQTVSGFSLKTNVPKFKISTSRSGINTFPKNGHYEGGINGSKKIDYYLDNLVKTDTIKIIPFVNPNNFNNNSTVKYFIKNVSIFKSNKNVVEGFYQTEPGTEPGTESASSNNVVNPTSELLTDLQESIEIDKACSSLKKQEELAIEENKLNELKMYNLKLQKQKLEFDKLNSEITALKEARRKQMEKEDMINIATYQKQRGAEAKLRDIALSRNKKSINTTFNLNMIKKKNK